MRCDETCTTDCGRCKGHGPTDYLARINRDVESLANEIGKILLENRGNKEIVAQCHTALNYCGKIKNAVRFHIRDYHKETA